MSDAPVNTTANAAGLGSDNDESHPLANPLATLQRKALATVRRLARKRRKNNGNRK